MEQIRRELGFVGVICLVGPIPNDGGNLGIALYVAFHFAFDKCSLLSLTSGCDGRTEGGRSILDVHPFLRDNLEELVLEFGEKAIRTCAFSLLVVAKALTRVN